MGYEDRDYMRVAGGDRSERGSNPLWWVLGLIVVILVLSWIRRGSLNTELPPAAQAMVEAGGPLRTSRFELAPQDAHPGEMLSLLKTFFHDHGYDSTIHESADRTRTNASFTRTGSELCSRHVVYQRIGAGHRTLKPRHRLMFHLYCPLDASQQAEEQEQFAQLSGQLRLQIEGRFPGIVIQVDDTPRPLAYDDNE